MKQYFKVNRIANKITLESNPECDFGVGYDMEEGDDYTILPNSYWFESGLISIKRLIEQLKELQSQDANYVTCYWHEDHQELELIGYEFRQACESEIVEFKKKIAEEELESKQAEIKRLEDKLKQLKSE